MKGIVCNVCGFISINGAKPDKCPVCGAPKESFQEKEDAVKTPKDVVNLTDFEKKHMPLISPQKQCAPIHEGCQGVQVKVGQIEHPMLPEHYIMRIDFYLDREFLSRVIFTPGKLNPVAVLCIKASGAKLSAIELCNLHGAWIQEIDL